MKLAHKFNPVLFFCLTCEFQYIMKSDVLFMKLFFFNIFEINIFSMYSSSVEIKVQK
jgi:hypothetical protein